MAQTQNMGRYYPPDFDPQKEGFNTRSGKHPLGNRARKLDEGILIVRFELPFNVWCGGCGGHIGQGVRYNAEKRKVGMYYTTPIWAFRCKTACCQHWMEIRTDPKNTRYVVEEGARQQVQDWDPEENGGHPIQDDGTGGPSSIAGSSTANAFEALEKTTKTKASVSTHTARILELEEVSTRWSDPYAANSVLRSSFRKGRREREDAARVEGEFKRRLGWGEEMKLLEGASAEQQEEDRARWKEERERMMRVGEVGRLKRLEGPSGAESRDKMSRSSGTSLAVRKPSGSASSRNGSRLASGGKVKASSSEAVRKQVKRSQQRSTAAEALAQRLRNSTKRRMDPFERTLRAATKGDT